MRALRAGVGKAKQKVSQLVHAKRPALAISFLVVSIGVVLVLVIWLLPEILTRTELGLTGKELLEAKNSVRVTLLQALGGAILVAGLYFTSRTLQLNRLGQITERYAKSIELLGSDAIDVRVGGIFALERLAIDSGVDSGTISAVLVAFIRERTSKPGSFGRKPLDSPVGADVQAALTVLGRWRADAMERVDLTGSGLSQARLYKGKWVGAVFNYSMMSGVTFSDSDMTRADLSFSKVRAGGFLRVQAAGMHFVRSQIQGWFCGADLSHADFTYADLTGADFGERPGDSPDSPLRTPAANLSCANFTQANLDGTILCGADLRTTVGISRAQFSKAVTNANTLPPAEWAEDPEEVGPKVGTRTASGENQS